MGVPSKVKDRTGDVTDRVGETAHEVADSVRRAPEAIGRRTQGNPLAVGLIAFGAGLLAASLLPETDAERRAGERIREQAGDLVEPLKQPLAEAAGELRDDVADHGRQAMAQVKETVSDGVQETKVAAAKTAGR
jgi:hypothetical protein